ncbi:MAG: hypothetical protein FWG38_08720, partial [Defluviitaleaceae bacterium]|nr:hypothetical protein [Defluviitaleaceae bacterium]
MKYAYAAILAIMILLVSACNGSESAPEQTTDHVLTILARNTYEGPIRQAEQALIAEWTQRPDKAGHTFSIELTTFHPDDEMNHLTRLDTMLMAGQAYDIFFPVADHRHLREYALSGFLTDFYPLIENCQHSNLDDFFANALEAWDIDGSLYVFPWDFCFSFAFMNAALPPHLIERFNAHSTITVTELTDMYRELLFYHGYHFGHFAFSHGSTLHHPSRILASSLGDFVGFENGTANITDDAFISFLTTFSAVFDERHFHQQGQPYWQNWWTR